MRLFLSSRIGDRDTYVGRIAPTYKPLLRVHFLVLEFSRYCDTCVVFAKQTCRRLRIEHVASVGLQDGEHERFGDQVHKSIAQSRPVLDGQEARGYVHMHRIFTLLLYIVFARVLGVEFGDFPVTVAGIPTFAHVASIVEYA
jgi:hypothetical protein